MKKGSQELILLEHEFDSGFWHILVYFCICIDLPMTNYSCLRTNEKDIGSEIFRKTNVFLVNFFPPHEE